MVFIETWKVHIMHSNTITIRNRKLKNHFPPALNFLHVERGVSGYRSWKNDEHERYRFSALRNRVLGKFTRKNKTNTGLDFPR